MNIFLSYDFPPIPYRGFDWSATWDDVDCDYSDEFGFHSDHPYGTGATPEEAITDLLDSTYDTRFDDGRIQGNGEVRGDGLGGIGYA